MNFIKNYKYKNLTLFFVSILIAINLYRFDFFNQFLFSLGHLAFIGPLIAGILFVSVFTTALGILILLDLTKVLSPLQIALIAGLGAVIGDFAIFSFFKNNLLGEIKLVYHKLGGEHLTKILRHKYLDWTLPLIGAIIIASPFPDELGISLMGISKIKNYQFIILSFTLNAGGIFLFVSSYSLLRS
jgi:hypothetical protein